MKRFTAKVAFGVYQQSLAIVFVISVIISSTTEALSVVPKSAHDLVPFCPDAGTASPRLFLHSSESSIFIPGESAFVESLAALLWAQDRVTA